MADPESPEAAVDGPTVRSVLLAAARRAEAQKTLRAAIQNGWSACHASRPLIGVVFRTWADAEGVRFHPSNLGGVLQRRYNTPAEIGASLRAAAEYAADGGSDDLRS